MQIGFDIRVAAAMEDPDVLIRLVTEGEALGFDYTTVSDHLVVLQSQRAKYETGGNGTSEDVAYGRGHEQLAEIAFLAGRTSRLRFVTSVMVLPYRPPVVAAKMLSTIDVLSGGRLTVGVGTGWIENEFQALGAPDFSERGRVSDEYLEAIKELWTGALPSYEGRHVRFSGIAFEPKPVQKPHPPVWVGGMSRPAMRRAVRLGDVWYPMLNDQVKPLDSLQRLRAGIAAIRDLAEREGRDPDTVGVAVRVVRHGDPLAPASDGDRRLFAGSADELAADLSALRELGIAAVDFRFTQTSADAALSAMQALQRDIVARL